VVSICLGVVHLLAMLCCWYICYIIRMLFILDIEELQIRVRWCLIYNLLFDYVVFKWIGFTIQKVSAALLVARLPSIP